MTVKYTFLRTGEEWAVVGPPQEMRLGMVQVQQPDGEMKTEHIVKLGKTFQTPLGPRRIGFIAALPQRFPVTTNVEEHR